MAEARAETRCTPRDARSADDASGSEGRPRGLGRVALMASPLTPNSTSADSRIHAAPLQTPGISLEVPSVATPMARLPADGLGSASPPRGAVGEHPLRA